MNLAAARHPGPACCGQLGYSLLELLLALLLFAVAVAGTAATQLGALRASEEAARHLRSSVLAVDFLRRAAMQPALAALHVAAAPPASGPTAAGSCRGAERCGAAVLAAAQLETWGHLLAGATGEAGTARPPLPGAGSCSEARDGGLGLSLQWQSLGTLPSAEAPACGSAGEGFRSLSLARYLGREW